MPAKSPKTDGRTEADRPDAFLAATGVVAGYGSPVVLGVSLRVGRGEVVSIVGPNGCGKSTLLKALLGLIPMTGGTVELGGQDITKTETHLLARKQIGYVPQSREVFDALTVLENLQIAGHGMSKREFAERLDGAFDSAPQLVPLRDRRAGVLSGGERRILAIAMALLVPRQLLVLDEPTAALAPSVAARFLETQIPQIAERGIAVLIVEQRVAACLAISDWAYSMVAGEVHLSAPPAGLLASDDFARSLVG